MNMSHVGGSDYGNRSSLDSTMHSYHQDTRCENGSGMDPHLHDSSIVNQPLNLSSLEAPDSNPARRHQIIDSLNMGTGSSASGGAPRLEFRAGTTWKLAYQRNNKSKDQKNLRCFPNCCLGFGHQDGFCGQSITVVFDYIPASISANSLVACGEFAVDGSSGHVPGSIITLDCINKHGAEDEDKKQFCYMKGHRMPLKHQQQHHMQQLHSSELGEFKSLPGHQQTLFEFNRNLKGWHYGFLGSKKTRNMYHVFRAYVLEKVQEANSANDLAKYKVLAMCQSPPWQMYCRRRKYNHIVQKKSRRVVGSSASEAAEAEMQIQRQIDEEASKAAAAKAMARRVASANARNRIHGEHLAHPMDPINDLTGDSYVRNEPMKRARGAQSMASDAGSFKRRPKAISIPAPRSDHRRSGSMSEYKSEGLDVFGSISLDNQGVHDFEAQFASLQRGGAPLPNLSSPSGLHSDTRFERLVKLIRELGLPEHLEPHKFSVSNQKMGQFSQQVCSFLVHWKELITQWPPQIPYRAHEYIHRVRDPHDKGAENVLDDYERFALFMLTRRQFRHDVTVFAKTNQGGLRNADPYEVSVFALKLFTEHFQHFLKEDGKPVDFRSDTIVKEEGGRTRPVWISETSENDHNTSNNNVHSALSAGLGPGTSAPGLAPFLPGNYFDISLTPRANHLNQEDYDMLQASLQTPRGLSGGPAPWGSMGNSALGNGFRFSSFNASGKHFDPNTLTSASSSSSFTKESNIGKSLSGLTPKNSFLMTPKGSFMLSPKNSFSLNPRFLNSDPKMDLDMMNLPSPGFRSPRLFAQVDTFLEDTKDYPSLASANMSLHSPSAKDSQTAFKAFMSSNAQRGSSSNVLMSSTNSNVYPTASNSSSSN